MLCFLFRIGFGQDSSYVLLDCQTPIRSWCKFAKFFSNFDMSKKNYVQVFANPEDIKGTPNKVDFASEDVERVQAVWVPQEFVTIPTSQHIIALDKSQNFSRKEPISELLYLGSPKTHK